MGVTESTSCDIRVAVYRLTWSGVENCHRWLSLTTTHLNSLDSVGPSTALSASACLLLWSICTLALFGSSVYQSHIASTNPSSWPLTRPAVPKIHCGTLFTAISHILNISLVVILFYLGFFPRRVASPSLSCLATSLPFQLLRCGK